MGRIVSGRLQGRLRRPKQHLVMNTNNTKSSLSPSANPVKEQENSLLPRLGPVPSCAGVLVAVSGGGDSVALAILLKLTWAKGASPWPWAMWTIVCARTRLGTRHSWSGWPPTWGWGFSCGGWRWRKRGPRPRRRPGWPGAGRFWKWPARPGRKLIALGHTLDDQAETLLHRALVGTGPTGLAGMRPRVGCVWRPLLDITRRELRDYLRAKGQTWQSDPTNRELDYARNRVRQKLMPLAQEFINPKAPQALARLAGVSAQEEDYWRRMALEFLNRHAWAEGSSLCLAAGPLLDLHPAAQRRMLRYALEGYLGSGQHLGLSHLEQLRDLLPGAPGRQADLPGGLWAGREPDILRLDNAPPRSAGA